MGKGGYPLKAVSGIALEPQNFPDAPNKPNFPNAVLHPGDLYHHQIVYRFRF
jgi:aldose 1-epimerase